MACGALLRLLRVFAIALLFFNRKLNGQSPTTGLFFMLNDDVYLPGASVPRSLIGSETAGRGAGSTLRCVTTNVNIGCCRSGDNDTHPVRFGGAVGDWLYPDGTIVPRPTSASDFSRRGFLQEVRLTVDPGNTAGPLGTYTCIVPHGVTGENITANITLEMDSVTAVMITTTPTNPSVAAGSIVSLTCSVTVAGSMTPTFVWTTTGSGSTGLLVNQQNQATVMGKVRESDAGTYTCEASISESSQSDTVTLTVTKPSISASVTPLDTPTVLRSYSLNCSTNAPDSLEFMSTSYEWTRNGNSIAETSSVLTFNSLPESENNAVYRCRFMASSTYLTSSVDVTSPPHTIVVTYAIPSTPSNLVSSSIQSTRVTLTWSSSSTDFVNMYTISYSSTGSDCGLDSSNTQTTTMTTITISGLEENIPYEFRITARNTAGESQAARHTITTQSAVPTEAPQPMLVSRTATSFTVTWDRESCLTRNGPDRYYSVRYYETGSTPLPPTTNINVNNRMYTANSLTPDTSYIVEVAYSNSVGSSPFKSLSISTLGYDTITPSTPTDFQSSSGSTQVTLTWSSPPPPSIVHNYTISYSSTGSDCGLDISNTQTITMTTITITGLEENIPYTFSLTAANNGGTSPPAQQSITTQSDVPAEAPQLTLKSYTATSFTVSWNRESCLSRNGPDQYYLVIYYVTGSTEILETSNVNVFNRMFTANTLNPVTSYTVQVAYVNTVGSGPNATLNITTLGLPFHGYLKGVPYQNNSLVNLSDIGVDENSLICYTDLVTCCRGEDNPNGGSLGNWRLPDGSLAISRGSANMSMFSRNRNKQAILLHRGSNATEPSGIFTCTIPNMNNEDQRLYFGIYPIGEGTPEIQSVSLDSTIGIVTCISTGGPVTNLTWNRNDEAYQPSNIIVNTVTATYHNILYISGNRLSDYTGIFMCTVSNSRGSTSRATDEYKSIGLSGNRNTYDAGSTASVICFSNFTVVSMRWINKTSDISFSTNQTRSNELQLNINDVITQETHGTSFTCEVTYLLPTGEVKESLNFTIRTQEELSGPVLNLSLSTSDSSVQITWMLPDMPNGVITAYYIRLLDLKINNAVVSTNLFGNQTSYTQSGLDAGVPYEVNISPINSIGLGENMIEIFFTQELKSSKSPSLTVQRTSATMMLVSWTPLTLVQARGFVTNYTIYYSVSNSRKRQQPSAMSKTVAANITSTTIDGLDENAAYFVQISANNRAGSGPLGMAISVSRLGTNVPSSGTTTTVIGIVVAIVLAAIAVAIIVTVILFIMKSRRSSKYTPTNELVMYSKGNEKKSPISASPQKAAQKKPLKPPKELEANSEQCDDQTYENTAFLVKDRLKPVPIDEFGAHVCRMHADRDKWFEMEYNSIEKSAKLDYKTAIIPENRARNRFGNIYPYDYNRVILSSIPDVDHSDYINASYVNGFGRKKVYIAAQGPMENSIDDFWRMIWEEKSPTIVMLTRVFEGKKKCEEYWPQSTSDPFVPCSGSSFVIELKSSLPFAEFVIKKMTIKKIDSPGSPIHDVILFHYLGWPDHGVPANAISMINFIRRVRKSHPYSNTDLMVVHCSAGVGRTGTFITLDYMLERIKTDKSINTYQFVSELRKQRVLMVQTMAQYVFIHNALDELLTCGDTEVAAANMRIVIGRLSRPVEAGSKDSGFQRQYDILNKVTSELRSVDFSQSVNAANSDKNRYDDRIPFNHTRVRLRPAAAQGSDYINASFVEGYRQKGAYIATQGPLPHTVNDFWRLIWEQECRCIVMLCKTEENGKEVCHRYWPQGKGSSEDYGKLTVTVTDQKAFSDYVIRKLEIAEKQTRMSVTPTGFSITQFQYLRWQEDTVPNSTSAILEIANLVQKVQMSTGNKSILVMCNDGVGRSGTFITIHAQMERMKSEAVIDVFQFIKSVRFQRSGLVANKDQYAFCYQVLADFLDGFDTYANFKEII